MKTKHKYTLFTGAGLLACFLAVYAIQGQPQAATEVTIEELSGLFGTDIGAGLCSVQTKSAPAKEYAQTGVTNAPVQVQSSTEAMITSPELIDHSHTPVTVPDGAPTPRLSVAAITPDIMSGFNLTLASQNYEFMVPPEGLSMEQMMAPTVNAQTGFAQGHAHLYINGEKIQRVYAQRLHLPASLFKPGMNQLNITLNNHAHMYWTSDNKEIIASLFINPSAPKLILHQFESFPTSKQ